MRNIFQNIGIGLIYFLLIIASFTSDVLAQTGAIGIRINDGAHYTNKLDISVEVKSLQLADNLVESYRIGLQENLEDLPWSAYRPGIKNSLKVSDFDGEKTVYGQLKDKAGNISPVASASITLDRQPPQNGWVQINNGAKYSNDPQRRVVLSFVAEDVAQMQISNNGAFTNTKWEPFVEQKRWTLDPGVDGDRKVFVRFRDEANNVSDVYEASIISDVTPPGRGMININNGERITNKTTVQLSIEARDADSVFIQTPKEFRQLPFEKGASGKMEIPWELDSAQGTKPFRVFFGDAAGNRGKAIAESAIILDTTPPQAPMLSIDNGKKYTNSNDGSVILKLNTAENTPNLLMKISNDPNMDKVESRPFAPAITNWKIDASDDGEKKVYAQIIDAAGNISPQTEARIILDRTPPKIKAVNINNSETFTNQLNVSVFSEVDEAFQMQISNIPSFPANLAWEKFVTERKGHQLNSGDGQKNVFVRFRDEAGNIAGPSNASIILDTKAPAGKFSINKGSRFTNNAIKAVSLSLTYDDETYKIQLSNKPSFDDLEWMEPAKEIESWTLDGDDGTKTVFLRLKDKAGNISKPVTSQIILDREAPKDLELVINNGNEWLTNRNKRVALSLRAEGARSMMVSNHPEFEKAQWMPFKTALSWTLEGEEGEHKVYARFSDEAGNISETVSASIKSDFNPPYVERFTINNDEEYTNNPQRIVQLSFAVREATSMIVSNNSITDPNAESQEWVPFQSEMEWLLSNEDGLKTVFVRFKDQAGNVTSEFFDKIYLDRVPPQDEKIIINNNSEWITNPEGKISLQLFAKGASEMRIGNTADLSDGKWENYSPTKEDWLVDLREKKIQVFVKYRDRAGNESAIAESNVAAIDINPPKNASISINNDATYTNNAERKVNVAISVEGADFMYLGFSKSEKIDKWEPVAGSKEIILPPGDGEKQVYAIFKDKAGNVSEWAEDKIILDLSPPIINAFTVDNGELWTNDPGKKVSLQIDCDDAIELFVSFDPEFKEGRWQSFSPDINDIVLPGDDGEKKIYIRLKDEAGNISKPATSSINLKRAF